MDTEKYAALFRSEGREQLDRCEALLLEWERQPGGTAPVAELFRIFHSIKGMAATMGYAHLAGFTHAVEHLLEAIRSGRVAATTEVIGLMVEAVDVASDGVEDASAGADGLRIPPRLVARLSAMGESRTEAAGTPPAGEHPLPAGAGPGFRVSLQIRPGVAMPWARALLALRRAGEFGVVHDVLPPPASVDPERFDGRLTFRLETGAEAAVIREQLLEVGDVARCEVEGAAAEVSLAAAAADIRVEREELDHLMTEVGELVVGTTRLAALAERLAQPQLEALAAEVGRWSDAIHHRVLRLRMVPVALLFQRVSRAVRDLSRELGKQVRLEMSGREIEADRSVLDALAEPLLHLVRNAIDHGLESPGERLASGKPPEGVLRLSASRVRDGVEILVSDDGRGVDRERVLARAGLAPAGSAQVDDHHLLDLLARPGFSTAESVTGVSGRGVGMDVVVTRVRGLGGQITLQSAPGQGTTFILRLPETLAVVPALLVGAAEERYAIPLAKVMETGGAVPGRRGGGLVVTFRGEDLPATDLRERVGMGRGTAGDRRPFVIVAGAGGRAALLVDRLLGRQDLVISALDAPVGVPAWLTGAATLGDGVPALLLDPTGIVSVEAA